jgi:DNA transformation protein
MAVSASFLAFVLEQLDGLRGVVTKRMFGGVGVYAGETFFAVMDNDTLFFKVNEPLAERYRKAGMPPFAPIPGKPPMLSYYQVPPRVLEDSDELAAWARESIAAAAGAPRKRGGSKRGKPRGTPRRRA